MDLLMQYLGYSIAFGCALFALHLISIRSARSQATLLLAAIFLVFAIQSALLSMLLASGPSHIAAIVRPSLAMTIGPLLWLYFRSIANSQPRLHPPDILHFLPATVIATELLTSVIVVDIDLAIIASLVAYSISLTILTARGVDQFSNLANRADDAFRLLLVGTVLMIASALIEIAIAVDMARGGGTLAQSRFLFLALVFDFCVISVAVLAALRRPSPLDWIYGIRGAFGGHRDAALNEIDCNAIIAAFEHLLNEEIYYKSEATGLGDAARRLGRPKRQLSEAINRTYGESFSRRLNRKRVEEAKSLLNRCPEMRMTDVMFESGFRTKSSFNKEFLAIENVSPSAFRSALNESQACK